MATAHFMMSLLKLLEEKPRSSNKLQIDAEDLGFFYEIKTCQRAVKDLKNLGIDLICKKRIYHIPEVSEYARGLANLMKKAFETSDELKSVAYGDIDTKCLHNILAGLNKPAEFVSNLTEAVLNSRRIKFSYLPQHPDTQKRAMFARMFFPLGTPKGIIPVSMIPHYLVFSANHFLVLGESKIGSGTFVRQYAVQGISKLTILEKEEKREKIDPKKHYQYSMDIWVGGKIHKIEIEEYISIENKPAKKKLKEVNGEEEILSYALASLGRVKIVNPPEEIRRKASALGLPEELIFRTENSAESNIA